MKLDRKQILTIPNMLSVLRLMMIPLIVAFYLNGQEDKAAAMLVLSGLTDVADGLIARKFGHRSSHRAQPAAPTHGVARNIHSQPASCIFALFWAQPR